MPRGQKVVPLHPRRKSSEELPVPLERLGVAVQELDDLRRCIERMVRDPPLLAPQEKAAYVPLMLRLPRARQSLADLAVIRAGLWPDIDWAVRLRAARDEAERRLLEVTHLVQGDTSGIEALFNFNSDGVRLAEAVNEVCGLIASRYPEAVGRI